MASRPPRETFASRLGVLATMVGVAVGLGNVWRFPYLVGKFGGAAFVAVYALMVFLVGLPALLAEWILGRTTRRGPVGAYAAAGLAGGKALGWLLFAGVTAATAYYTNALGWVLHAALAELLAPLGVALDPAAILPPEQGFAMGSFLRQIVATGTVIVACAIVLRRGLRAGIEVASRWIMPILFGGLLILIVRALTLPGAGAGLDWYLLKVDVAAFSPGVILAALGQAVFSLSLGGTFMVVYGSYLEDGTPIRTDAALTAGGDLAAGLLAGLAILPAVIALGMEPASGPGLLFFTLPKVFAAIPFGALFGALFFLALFGAAFLSDVAAFEVLVAGLTDNTRLDRRTAVTVIAAAVFVVSLPPMLNLRIFVPWDLTFGSGMQTLGALLAVVTVGWTLDRARVLAELGGDHWSVRLLVVWLRWVVPAGILTVGAWWLATEVLGT